jgi:preprotein translocase subunit SecB
MAEQTEAQAQRQPQLRILAQYTKDLSFENPNAPRSLQPRSDAAEPQVNISVNVNATKVGDDQYAVDLHLEGRATSGADLLFAFDLTFGAVMQLDAVPEEQVQPVVMVECPRLLFPFARQIVAEAVRNGGFPPLYIDPIDFVAIYNQSALNRPLQAA